MSYRFAIAVFLLLLTAVVIAQKTGTVSFKKIVLDTTFRSEGVTVADFNKDGKMDVLAGNLGYSQPDWKPLEIAPPLSFDAAKGYSNSFINFAADINGDGWSDQILIDTPGTVPVVWRENPGTSRRPWSTHRIARNACNESPAFARLTGAGSSPVLIFALDDEQMVWLEPSATLTGDFTVRPISDRLPKGEGHRHRGVFRYSHGLGTGDLNHDGRIDVVIRSGYWAAPKDPRSTPWPFVETNLGDDCAQMQVYDVNLDGLNDVITSSAHGIGVWWFEQSIDSQG